jgi:hypothetical protein
MNDKIKQTGVEYLVEQLFPKALSVEQHYHIEKAKEMEKEQHRVTAQDFYYASHSFKNFEQYYNETYGGGEQ